MAVSKKYKFEFTKNPNGSYKDVKFRRPIMKNGKQCYELVKMSTSDRTKEQVFSDLDEAVNWLAREIFED